MRGKILFSVICICFSSSMFSQQTLDVFTGNQAFSDRQLLAALGRRVAGFSVFSLYKPQTVNSAAEDLKHFYQEKGFPLVKVQVKEVRKKVNFGILEGPKAALESIEITGNHRFSSQQLRQVMGLKSRFNSDDLEKALARVRQLYHDNSYVRVKVGPARTRVVEVKQSDHFPIPFQHAMKNEVRLSLPINEGTQFHYGNIRLPEEISGPEFSPPLSDKPYQEKDLLLFRERVKSHFTQLGKLIRQFDIYQNIPDGSHQVDLIVQYKLLPKMVVGKIDFVGNTRYPDSFYRREMKQEEQQFLDPDNLKESLEGLKNTGVLTSYEVELKVRDADSEIDIILHLLEKDQQRVAYSFGSDGLGGSQNSIVYSIFNLLGLGEELGVDLSRGPQGIGVVTSLTSRYLLGTTIPMSMALRFFRRHTGVHVPNADEQLRKLLRVNRVGLSVGTSYRIHSNQQAGVLVSGQRVTTSVSSTNFGFEPFWLKSNASDGIQTENIRVSQRFSLFQGPLDSWDFRPTVDYRRYFPGLTEQSPTFAFRFQASHAHFLGKNRAPVTERLFGDPYGIRGFNAVSTGPWARFGDSLSPVGGDTLLTLNSEYRIPLNGTFEAVPFFDTGLNMALAHPDGYDLVDLSQRVWRASLGSELRIHLPWSLPATRLIWAWNPLRLDRNLLSAHGLARLRDPARALRVALEPPF